MSETEELQMSKSEENGMSTMSDGKSNMNPGCVKVLSRPKNVDDINNDEGANSAVQEQESLPDQVKVSTLNPDAEPFVFKAKEVQAEPVVDETHGQEDSNNNARQQHKDGMQNKRQMRNTSDGKFKRKKMDKNQYSGGHMLFQEKEFPNLEYTDYLRAQMEIESHFNKKFAFNKPAEDSDATWKLPPVETMYTKEVWQDEELQAAKCALNNVKKQLTDKDIATWHAHTKNTNPSERIALTVRRRASPEMVTQAWLKFYEILNTFPVVPSDELENSSEEDKENIGDKKPFHSVHICEAPGAFILALNHYLALLRPKFKWQWLGNTLNPYYEGTPADVCIVEDKFIYHTLDNWTFGQNNTGDLMEKENLEDLIHRANYMGPVNLVTADGSIDCQTNPGDQESMTHNLHLCEVVSALSILAPGGSFVVKKFTTFECETVCLVYLLCCVFKEVQVLKPGTSKEGNSEVYVVCMNYLGRERCEPHLQKLKDVYGTFVKGFAMFNVGDLPEDFMVQLKKCGEIFKAHQINTITKNIALFGNIAEKEQQYNELLKTKANTMFFERCFCDRIPKQCTLTEYKVNKTRYLLENDLNKPITSTIVRENSSVEKRNLCRKYLTTYVGELMRRNWIIEITKKDECNIATLAKLELSDIEFDVLRGKPFTRIKSSKFCSQRVLECYRTLYKLVESLPEPLAISSDESLLQCVTKDYPNAQILKTTVTPDPTYDLGTLLETLSKIKEKQLSTGDTLALVNVTLLSRMQCGLLFLLGCAFQNVAVVASTELGAKTPIIILENFKSPEVGESVMSALYKTGWDPYADADMSAKFLQLVPYHQLVENLRLSSLFYYNLNNCIHLSWRLIHALEGKLE